MCLLVFVRAILAAEVKIVMNRLLIPASLAALAALAGVATAEEFNPGESIWVQFGDPDQVHGLYLLDWAESPLVTRGGRYGRETSQALYFRVDPRFLHEPMPVRVVVEYWDEGTDFFLLRYGSTDTEGQHRGEDKRTCECFRTDTRTWQQVVFRLPDARFVGSAWDKDFSVRLDHWFGIDRQKLIVSGVEVVKGGVYLSASPEAVPADGETPARVEARVYDRSGSLVRDGTPVQLACTAGTIEPRTAVTADGRAIAAFTGTRRPGSADITATALGDSQTIIVPMLEGKGPIHEVTYVLDDFLQPERWRIHNSEDVEGRLAIDNVMAFRKRPVARWDYHFRRQVGRIRWSRRIPIPGRVKRLSIWANEDSSGSELSMYFRDAAGAEVNWILPKMWSRGWRWGWEDIGRPWDRYGECDFRISWPITLDYLDFVRYRLEPDVGEIGTIYFQDLAATCLVPESSLVWPRVELGTPREEAPGRMAPCEVLVHNLGDEAYRGLCLEVAVIDHVGRSSVREEATFSLAPREIKTFDCSFRPKHWGDNTVEAQVRGGSIDAVGRSVLAIGPLRD